MESQPKIPEFRTNPENFQHVHCKLIKVSIGTCLIVSYLIRLPSSSKLFGICAPASFNALFLASAVSASALAQDPA